MKMKTELTITALLLLASCATVPRPELKARHSHDDVRRVKRQLAAINVGEVSFRPDHVADAILFWMEITQERDPEHRGASAVFTGYGHSFVGTTNLNVEGTVPQDNVPTVTLKVESISSLEFLNEICRQADLVWWMKGKGSVFNF